MSHNLYRSTATPTANGRPTSGNRLRLPTSHPGAPAADSADAAILAATSTATAYAIHFICWRATPRADRNRIAKASAEPKNAAEPST